MAKKDVISFSPSILCDLGTLPFFKEFRLRSFSVGVNSRLSITDILRSSESLTKIVHADLSDYQELRL
jgi:hypothetical protein